MQDPVIWALALNSETARILPGLHRTGHLDAPEIAMHIDHQRLQDLMADKPGRAFESVGGRRSAMEYASDPVRDLHRAFLHSVLQRLQKARHEAAFDQLAIFASRPMLGMFRQEAPPEIAALVVREVDKNLLHLSPQTLARTVAQTLFELPDGAPSA